jgi:uncharacterized membrane protein (TIGR02234 family)
MIRIAQVLLLLAAIGLWAASRLRWVTLQSFDGLGQPRTTTLAGASWSTALVPLAVLLLAAAVAALAVRGWPLRLLAAGVAASSAAAAYLGLSQWVVPDVAVRAAGLAQLPVAALVGSQRYYAGAAITLVAAVCTLLAAVLLMRAAVRGSGGGRERYAAPAERRAAAIRGESGGRMSERMMWDAIDEGHDPTRDSDSEGR